MARLGLPAFIANVADSASSVVCAAGDDHPAAHRLQERRGALGFGQHPELVGRPRQRPRHQLGLRQRRRIDLGEHRVGIASAALPRQRVGQRQPRGQARRPRNRGAAEPLAQFQVAQPQRFLGGRDELGHRLRDGHCPGPAPRAAAGPQRRAAATAASRSTSSVRSRRRSGPPSASRTASTKSGCAGRTRSLVDDDRAGRLGLARRASRPGKRDHVGQRQRILRRPGTPAPGAPRAGSAATNSST